MNLVLAGFGPRRALAAKHSVMSNTAMMEAVTVTIGSAAMLWIVARAFAETTHQSVDGHQFDAPKDQLSTARIAWLLAPDSDSFTFLFEPNPNPGQIQT
jgi:hypothetical protein